MIAPFDGVLISIDNQRARKKLRGVFNRRRECGLLPCTAQMVVYAAYVLLSITPEQLGHLVRAAGMGMTRHLVHKTTAATVNLTPHNNNRAQVEALRESGLSLNMIAAHLGCTKQNVSQILKRIRRRAGEAEAV